MSSSGESVLWPGRVRSAFVEAFGDVATVEDGFGPVTVDVPPERWVDAARLARDHLGCTFFDWLSAVDELANGFRVVCHLARHRPGVVEHLLVRTLVTRAGASAPSLGQVFAGARWHERETHEMFGLDFTVDGAALDLEPLLLPENFEGHPLRKDFVLASRVAKPWPGAKEPGESDSEEAPSRRRTRPPGVPEPEQWGPRAPGSDRPDPLAAAASTGPSPRPRRTPRPAAANRPAADGPAADSAAADRPAAEVAADG